MHYFLHYVNIMVRKRKEVKIMTKQELLDKIQKDIEEAQKYLTKLDEKDYVERGITLGKINGLLTAKLYAHDLGRK